MVRLEPPAQSGWRGLRRERYVFYEIHVGTMTPAGTFDGVVPHLDRLVDLGITALEIMPVAEFPGERNWGYDGVCLYAAHHAYGGPWGLRRLTEACHERGLAVVLDVVYNHLGPEGNYLAQFGPYFTDRYHTPWGQAVNFDGADSDPVRRFFLENALWWLSDIGVDALRLDAVHAIADESEIPFLAELGRTTRVLAAGDEILAKCIDLGGSVTGEKPQALLVLASQIEFGQGLQQFRLGLADLLDHPVVEQDHRSQRGRHLGCGRVGGEGVVGLGHVKEPRVLRSYFGCGRRP